MREFHSPGKWILTGEHAVVRNHPAIVLPLHSRRLSVQLREQALDGDGGQVRQALEQALLRAAHCTGGRPESFTDLAPRIQVKSEIPIGAGLGSSAALCVGLVHILADLQLLPREAMAATAHEMEHIFHGQSSGMDVSVIFADKPLCFQKGEPPAELQWRWQPQLFLADTESRSSTRESVAHVAALRGKNPAAAEQWDQLMATATATAREALLMTDIARARQQLQAALEQADRCFIAWQLYNPAMRQTKRQLLEAGALAVKPTGSGQGGFMLSLWQDPPPAELGLIPGWPTTPE